MFDFLSTYWPPLVLTCLTGVLLIAAWFLKQLLHVLKTDYVRTIHKSISIQLANETRQLSNEIQEMNHVNSSFKKTLQYMEAVVDNLIQQKDDIGSNYVKALNDFFINLRNLTFEISAELERLQLNVDELSGQLDVLIEKNELIHKQQLEIENWQRRARKPKHDD